MEGVSERKKWLLPLPRWKGKVIGGLAYLDTVEAIGHGSCLEMDGELVESWHQMCCNCGSPPAPANTGKGISLLWFA